MITKLISHTQWRARTALPILAGLLCGALVGCAGETQMNDRAVAKTDAEWKAELTPMQYRVLREKATERPGSGEYNHFDKAGTYVCAGCGETLFSSETKYDSGCGWPSFYQGVDDAAIDEEKDGALGMARTEILCSKCGGHLGHVFTDGPKPTGLRYCVNSASLSFKEAGEAATPAAGGEEVATLGTGCFWCTEALLQAIPGVVSVEVGYTGGEVKHPSYKQVCSGSTGHAEAARITFDTSKLSYDGLLDAFWKIHDPTTLNRQGGDVGTQYRSAVFYHSPEQKAVAEASLKKHQPDFSDAIVTEISVAGTFYAAEDYHQDYYRNNPNAPYCRAVITPKLKKLEQK